MLITDPKQLQKYYSGHRVWQGIPGIARTKGGRTFISFYSGNVKETYGNYAVLLKSETDTDFGEPIAAVEKPGEYRVFDPVLWIDPLDRLWFIWNVMPGEQVMASICQDPDAAGADIFALVVQQLPLGTAENAGGLILLQHDPVAVHVDLQSIPFFDVQIPPQLNRKHDPPQFIDFAHDSC